MTHGIRIRSRDWVPIRGSHQGPQPSLHPDVFRGGREFAAWLGLVPRQTSTGGKQRLGRISRLGNKYIRQLLIVGAQTVLLRSKAARSNAWIQGLLARRPRLVVAVALANKMARIVWAVMAQGQSYRQAAPA